MPKDILQSAGAVDPSAPAPAAIPVRPRGQEMHRLQVGFAGVFAIVLLIGLVSLVEDRAQQVEANSVPQAAATAAPASPSAQPDPLVEAGVVPDLPASPSASATAAAPILPEQGGGERAPPIAQ